MTRSNRLTNMVGRLRAFAIVCKSDDFSDAADILEEQEKCIAKLKMKLHDANDLLVLADKKQDDIREELRQVNSSVTKLIIALKPFEIELKTQEENLYATEYLDAEKINFTYQLTWGDLRAARAALEEK